MDNHRIFEYEIVRQLAASHTRAGRHSQVQRRQSSANERNDLARVDAVIITLICFFGGIAAVIA